MQKGKVQIHVSAKSSIFPHRQTKRQDSTAIFISVLLIRTHNYHEFGYIFLVYHCTDYFVSLQEMLTRIPAGNAHKLPEHVLPACSSFITDLTLTVNMYMYIYSMHVLFVTLAGSIRCMNLKPIHIHT